MASGGRRIVSGLEMRDEALEIMRPRFIEENSFVGFDPPFGWVPIVLELHNSLLANPNYRIVQVKEKFGELRFYVEGLTNEERHMVMAAERGSTNICQHCGTKDSVDWRNHGWVATLCDSCDAAGARGYREALSYG